MHRIVIWCSIRIWLMNFRCLRSNPDEKLEERDPSPSQCHCYYGSCTRDLRHKANNRGRKVPRVSPFRGRTRSIPINHRHCADSVEAIHENRAASIGLASSAALVNAENLVLAVLIIDCGGMVGAGCLCSLVQWLFMVGRWL